MGGDSPSGPDRRRVAAATAATAATVAAVLFLLVLALFAPALRFSFLPFDDDTYLLNNPPIHAGLSAGSLRWAFAFHPGYQVYPLTWLSHAADFSLFGDDPAGHHAVSILLHAAATALLFLFLSKATGATGESAVVALLFGLHPLRSESVVWIAERKDVLSVFLALLVLLVYSHWASRLSGPRRAGLAALFLAGLLAKPMLVSLPLLLLLVDLWPLGRAAASGSIAARLRPLVLEKLPLFGLAAAAAAVTVVAQRAGGALATLEASPLSQRSATAAYATAWYAWKTLFPSGLSLFVPLRFLSPLEVWAGAGSVLLLAAAALHPRTSRPVRIGLLWYLIALFPVSGIVRIGDQLVADRYSYLPTIGLLIAAVFGLAGLIPRHDRKVRAAAAAGSFLVAGSFAVTTWSDLDRFRDGLTAFSTAAAVDGDNWLAHEKVGDELVRRGRVEEAVAPYRASLRARPNWDVAAGNLSQALLRTGRTGEALAVLEEGLRRNPGSEWLLRLGAVLEAGAGRADRARELAVRGDAIRARTPPRGASPAWDEGLRKLRESPLP